ncbi:MAG: energy-coupling factor transporter transmembrane component T [Acidobacteriota bacterium]
MERWQSMPLFTYCMVWMLIILLYQHPLCLTIMGIGLMITVNALGLIKNAVRNIGYILPVILMLLVINSLINNNGRQVLIAVQLLGALRVVYWEPLIFSLAMSLKLIDLMLLFVLINEFLEPYRIIELSGGKLHKPVLVMAMALRIVPFMGAEIKRVQESYRTRGFTFRGGLLQRTREYGVLARAALILALENAAAWAEAMQARGYGAGPRSHYFRGAWSAADHYVMAASLIALTIAVIAFVFNYGADQYYYGVATQPRVIEVIAVVALTVIISGPGILAGRWRNWQY